MKLQLNEAIPRLLRSEPSTVWTAEAVAVALEVVWRHETVRVTLGQLARAGDIHRVAPGRYAAKATATEIVDPVVVDRLCSTTWPSPASANQSERTDAVWRMAGWGLDDTAIAERLGGITASGVQAFRARNGIPTGSDTDRVSA